MLFVEDDQQPEHLYDARNSVKSNDSRALYWVQVTPGKLLWINIVHSRIIVPLLPAF